MSIKNNIKKIYIYIIVPHFTPTLIEYLKNSNINQLDQLVASLRVKKIFSYLFIIYRMTQKNLRKSSIKILNK
jgi:hypothetical protein